jgi:uncharacterized protein
VSQLKSRLRSPQTADIHLTGGFWQSRQRVNREVTLPAIYHQMKATGRVDAWKLDWQPGQPEPHIFWDSDAGKWIEAVGYTIASEPAPELEAQADNLIALIKSAQQPDGYLNIYFTSVKPQARWTNLRDWHELYDAGHLIEGAIAYLEGTGKRDLLEVLLRYADHINARFGRGEGQERGYCGHPEIELALVRLAEATGEQRYFDLARYFVDERGQQPHYFDKEARARGERLEDYWAKTHRYTQSHVPIREHTDIVGHSVRACYLYAGVTDIARETDDTELAAACRRMWDDLVQHKLYITGGLGPARSNEGFTYAYDLPNETAYAETCASIALVFWAQRMFALEQDSRYTDVMEIALYNNILAGVSAEGRHFFYANPLTSVPNVNPYDAWGGIIHTEPQYYHREEWFTCACCPPNLARMVASVGNYFYSIADTTIYTHLYGESSLTYGSVKLHQKTNYPWDGEITLSIETAEPQAFTLALRIPGWCREVTLKVNGADVPVQTERGYVKLNRTWADGDTVKLTLAMPIERMAAHPRVREDAGRIALQRGPIVYCLEETDNGADLANVVIPADSPMSAVFERDLFGGVCVIHGTAHRRDTHGWDGQLYRPQRDDRVPFTFRAIPYCFWANRQPGEMRVWIRES